MKNEIDFVKKPYSSRIINGYLSLIKLRYSWLDIPTLLLYAQMEPYQVADPGHWFSQEQVDLFYEKLVQMSGKRTIAREAGRFFSSIQDGNLMQEYFLSIIDPLSAYKKVEIISSNFTKYTEYKSKKLSNNSVEVLFTVKKSIQEKPYQCENRLGMMEAVPLLLGLKQITVEHPECLFKGDDCCKYIIKWEDSFARTLKKIQRISTLVLIPLNILVAFMRRGSTIYYSLICTGLFLLGLNIFSKQREITELKRKAQAFQTTTDEFFHQVEVNYNNTVITQKVSEVVNKEISIEETLEGTIQAIQEILEYDRGLILLANKDKTKLTFQSGYGYKWGFQDMLTTTDFSLTNPHSKGIFVVCFKERKPYLINNVEDIKKDLSLKSISFTKSIGAKSFICCPIVCDDEALGILSVDNLHTQRPLLQSDISLLMGIASIVGVGIKKIQLLKSRETQLQSIIKVLASSIDARDPLTSGHSVKVAEYADEICKRMSLSSKYRDMIHISSLLHDYGKIGVPDSILKKNGKLTTAEFDIIKTHVVKTKMILNQINFEGDLAEIPEIAGSHHEQINGGGYPIGLKGNQIPLGAKIIAVADFFDAITSRRHYRNPMSFELAVKTLKAESGWHLDPDVVKIFCEYLEDEHDSFVHFTPLQQINGV
ncbi:MAG: HD domain-containing protein [Spirochaetaceae bacterium]|nr:HD domain-containing protein [Spirochaetaceae bacterium]